MIVSLHQSAGAALGREPAADRAKPARIRIDYATWLARLAGHANQPVEALPAPEPSEQKRPSTSPAASSQSDQQAA